MLRGRTSTTFHLRDEQDRVVRTVTESPWTEEDRALMLAYRMYLDSLCSGDCGQPRALAHHPSNDGWYGVPERVTCHACTALKRAASEGSKEPVKPVQFYVLAHDRDYDTHPLPPVDADHGPIDLSAFTA